MSPLTPLKQRLRSGSFWTMVGYGASQAARLGSNLILTRLLVPEIFGVMALVQVVLSGLQMLSDIGISTSVTRDRRGDEAIYLNTAWTMQIIRAVILWIISCIVSFPLSYIYSAPELSYLIPMVAVSVLARGFHSSAVMSLKRHVKLKPLVVWELTGQIVSVLITLIFAWYSRSIWAIVAGGLLGSIVTLVFSYQLDQSRKHTFILDPSTVSEIWHFGRWVFISSFLSFVVNRGDILILGAFLTKENLGIFSIAAIWSKIVLEFLLKINQLLLLPLYAAAKREGHDQARREIKKTRFWILLFFLPLTWFLVIGGQVLIDYLYDSRYSSAGWILEILAIGVIGSVLTVTSANILLAFGDSFRFMIFQFCRGVMLIGCVIFGFYYYEFMGLIIGISASKFLSYPILALLIRRHGVWFPSLDGLAILLSFLVIGLWYFS